MTIYTIGFTKKSAREFFEHLHDAGIRALVDVRLNNVSQLAGFTKRADLAYFTDSILRVPYRHDLSLAPTSEMLDAYRKGSHDWATYEQNFIRLLEQRAVEASHSMGALDGACLLCTEPTAHRCHRRLAAEYFQAKWGAEHVSIRHL